MQLLGIVGPTAGEYADRLAERLAERGQVGVVRSGKTDAPDWTEYVVGDGWTGVGGGRSVDDAVTELARDHEYALLVDFPEARIPQIVVDETDGGAADDGNLTALGDADANGPVLRVEPGEKDLDLAVKTAEGVEPFETASSLVAGLKQTPDTEYAGAIATFTGCVRALDGDDDERTESLTFEKYNGIADDKMATIRTELEARDGVLGVRLHHRVGRVDAGEDIVFVAVLAGHRREAFRTVEDGINRLKEEVPLFKKEVTVSDEFWAHDGP